MSLSYEESVAGLQKLSAETPSTVREDCHPQWHLHERVTERVYVLFHGLSNGPPQFTALAKILFDLGHNVVVPLTPYHGEKDRMNSEWSRLTADEMLAAGNAAVDLAQGLGRQVIVAGLSTSGTIVAWMAQHRSDLHRAILLAPFFGPAGSPEWALEHAAMIATVLPNKFIWWDHHYKEALPGPDNVYPRFSTRVVARVVLFGEEILKESANTPPRCPSILLVTSASDLAADGKLPARLAANWTEHGATLVHYEFPAAEKIDHDFIDPRQPYQKTGIVYPKLLELWERNS